MTLPSAAYEELARARYVPGLPERVSWARTITLLTIVVPLILWGEAAIDGSWAARLLITSPGIGLLAIVLLLLTGWCAYLLTTLLCIEGRW